MSDITERTQPRGRYFAFGSHVIDVVRGVLWRDGVLLHLRPKDIEILVLLIEQRDRVVEKNDIFSCVWPGVVVEENNIARRISELRRVLGEGAAQRSFVATFPGRGYRFVADVEELTELPWGHDVPAPPPDAPSRSSMAASIGWKPGLSVGLFAIVAVVAILAFVDRSGTAAPAALARQFSFGAELHEHAAWSPDSRVLAYTSAHNGNSDIWLQDGADAKPRQITHSPAHDWQPAWSPDGQSLAFRSERDGGGIWLIDRDGRHERLLIRQGFAPQWSPDGQRILFSAAAGRPATAWPYVVDVDDAQPSSVLPGELAGSSNKYGAWHPDGRVSLWFRSNTGRWRFITTPATGGTITESAISADVRRELEQAGIHLEGLDYPFSRLERFVWDPSGRFLYFEALTSGVRSIWRFTVDKETLAWKQGPERITTGIGSHAQIALSGDGDRMAFTAGITRTRIWMFALDKTTGHIVGTGEPITPGRDTDVYTRVSADGQRMIYRSVQGDRNEFKLRHLPASSSHADHAVVSGIDRNHLLLSPDGARIVYTLFGARGPDYFRQSRLVTRPVDGGEERTVFASQTVRFSASDWSRDGELLLGRCATEETDVGICTLPADLDAAREDALVRIASSRDRSTSLRSAVFSPDGRWIAFTEETRTPPGASRIYVAPAHGGDWVAVTGGASLDDGARWSANGRLLYFFSNRTGTPNVWGQRIDPVAGRPFGEPFPVTSFDDPQLRIPSNQEAGIAVTDTHLFVPLAEASANIWVLSGLAPARSR